MQAHAHLVTQDLIAKDQDLWCSVDRGTFHQEASQLAHLPHPASIQVLMEQGQQVSQPETAPGV